MLGAIIGDVAGSRFERRTKRIKTKEFSFLHPDGQLTDDSILTIAVAQALLKCGDDYTDLSQQALEQVRYWGNKYPDCGFSPTFRVWLAKPWEEAKPYQSLGNGAAMRVSPCAWVAESLTQAKKLSAAVTRISHDHPEGLKGARAVTVAIYLAREGKTKAEIKQHISAHYYPLNFTIAAIREDYQFDATCPGSVPQAIEAFCEASDFEDAVRLAVSLGGDSDTQGAIAGSIAEAAFGIPQALREQVLAYFPADALAVLEHFEQRFGAKAGSAL